MLYINIPFINTPYRLNISIYIYLYILKLFFDFLYLNYLKLNKYQKIDVKFC